MNSGFVPRRSTHKVHSWTDNHGDIRHLYCIWAWVCRSVSLGLAQTPPHTCILVHPIVDPQPVFRWDIPQIGHHPLVHKHRRCHSWWSSSCIQNHHERICIPCHRSRIQTLWCTCYHMEVCPSVLVHSVYSFGCILQSSCIWTGNQSLRISGHMDSTIWSHMRLAFGSSTLLLLMFRCLECR